MRARLRFFFSPSRAKHPGNGLRERAKLLHRQEGVKQLRLIRNRAESAAHVNGKAANFLPVFGAGNSHQAKVVHVGKATGILRATAERGFEFAPEVLAVRVSKEKP